MVSLLPARCDPCILVTKITARSVRAVKWLSESIGLLSKEIGWKENDESKVEVSDTMLVTVVIFAWIEVSHSYASFKVSPQEDTWATKLLISIADYMLISLDGDRLKDT